VAEPVAVVQPDAEVVPAGGAALGAGADVGDVGQAVTVDVDQVAVGVRVALAGVGADPGADLDAVPVAGRIDELDVGHVEVRPGGVGVHGVADVADVRLRKGDAGIAGRGAAGADRGRRAEL